MRISFSGNTKLIKPELMKRGLVASALIVQAQAKNLAPIDTGRLRSSIIFTTSDFDGGAFPMATGAIGKDSQQPTESDRMSQPESEFVAKVGTNVEYAQYNEYIAKNGTNSFLRPAMFASKNAIVEQMQKALKESIEG